MYWCGVQLYDWELDLIISTYYIDTHCFDITHLTTNGSRVIFTDFTSNSVHIINIIKDCVIHNLLLGDPIFYSKMFADPPAKW